jgi:hypothetical protein
VVNLANFDSPRCLLQHLEEVVPFKDDSSKACDKNKFTITITINIG